MTDEMIEDYLPPHATLSTRQQKAAFLLANGTSHRLIAEMLSLSTSTLHEWKKLPEFSSQIDTLSSEIAHRFQAVNLRATIKAIRTLHRICFDENQKASDRLAAASKIIDLAINWHVIRPLEVSRQKLESANANGR